jgi:hypothetical protein
MSINCDAIKMKKPYPKNRKPRKYPSPAERLENGSMPVPFSGCHIWLGHTNKKGYGRLSLNRRLVLTHRLAWETYRGPIPSGLMVLHECDIPCCINPNHLFLGTNDDNVADRVKKGRGQNLTGESNPNAKLSSADVAVILASSLNGAQLAHQYGVSRTCINLMRQGKTWQSR